MSKVRAAPVSPLEKSKRGGRIAKHRAILEGALSVFLSDGYIAASMERVAEIACVSKRTIYNHFTSKDDLFMEIIGSMVDEILEPVDRTLSKLAPIEEVLLEFAGRYADVILSERRIKLHRLVMGEIGRFPSLGPYYTSGYSRTTRGVAQMLERLTRRGLLDVANFDQAATCFWQLTISECHNELLFAPNLRKEDMKLSTRLAIGVGQFLKIYGGKAHRAKANAGLA